MSYNMDGETYNTLYKRYLNRSPRELLELAGMKEGYVVWDLCSGSNGIVTKEALKMGASRVVAVDLNDKVFDIELPKVIVHQENIEMFLKQREAKKNAPNVVVCRQGVNYWFNEQSIKWLSVNMQKDSVFVFNTFGQKPSSSPSIKKYEIDGRHYVEVWQLKEDEVYHVQVAEGLEPHLTIFRWIPGVEFNSVLEPYFDIELHIVGKTCIYVCKRK